MEAAYRWISQRSIRNATRWFNGLDRAILSLAKNPQRFGLAPESDYFGKEIRQLLYGKRGVFTAFSSLLRIRQYQSFTRDTLLEMSCDRPMMSRPATLPNPRKELAN